MVLALDSLREEIDQGRDPATSNKGPFFDLIVSIAFGGECPEDKAVITHSVVSQLMELLAEDIRSLNFWEQPALISELEGKLLRVFVLSKEPAFKEKRDQLVTEVLALAKRRERTILGDVKNATE